ncbi:MAG: D-alanyl-D-alanine carboxypeptidase/D-alanyl-D-alanine-endopeptidase [Acidobacteriota bacterium]
MRLAFLLALTLVVAAVGSASADDDRVAWSWLAVRAADGAVIDAHDPDRRMLPASVHKLAVAIASLVDLGPDHRAVTTIEAGGPLEGGVVRGDLIVRGAIDPSWCVDCGASRPPRGSADAPTRAFDPLAQLAAQLRAAGVARVTGNLVIDRGALAGPAWPPSRAHASIGLSFAAPVSALAIDDSVVPVRIAPGVRLGGPIAAAFEGGSAAAGGIELDVTATTVDAARDGDGTVIFAPRPERQTIRVTGAYPISESPYRMRVSVPDADLYAGTRLRAALIAAGVAIDGAVRTVGGEGVDARPSPARGADAVTLARLEGAPVVAWVTRVLRDSHNWTAEMLLRHLAWSTQGAGRLDLGRARLRAIYEEAGVAPDTVVIDDGSGASRRNLLTPRAVVALVRHGLAEPTRAAALRQTLAAPDRGTLASWPALPADLVAKTGTLDDGVTLAGIVEGADGPVVFAIFANNADADARPALRQAIARRVKGWARAAH